MSNELNEITDFTKGKYKVTTSHGTYYTFEFDEFGANAKRSPADGRNPLQADNDWFRVIGVDTIKVGIPISMNVRGIKNDDWYTWRNTTSVASIEKLED